VANILRTEEKRKDLIKGKLITTPELMQIIRDDPHDLQISTEPPETRQVFADMSDAEWSSSDADLLTLCRGFQTDDKRIISPVIVRSSD
jgi:hypothetical protein